MSLIVSGESGAYCSHRAVVTDRSSVRPPTSFLDLPDDILLPIFEEFYEQRYESITPTTPLRIAEILITKRIFFLARPLWHRRLSISEAQLDARLSGLLEDKTRQTSLCNLEIPLNNSHANLTKSLISLLPRLTKVSLSIADDITKDARNAMADRLATIRTLRHIVLNSTSEMDTVIRLRSRFHSRSPFRGSPKISFGEGGIILFAEEQTEDHSTLMYRSSTKYQLQYIGSLWRAARSFDFQGGTGFAISSNLLIETLRQALTPYTVRTAQIFLRCFTEPENFACSMIPTISIISLCTDSPWIFQAQANPNP